MRHLVLIIDQHAEFFRSKIIEAGIDADVLAVARIADAMPYVADATVICVMAPVVDDAFLRHARVVQLIIVLTTGTDTITLSETLSPSVLVTNMRGIHGPQMSELAILQMLSLTRLYPRMLEFQKAKTWERWPQPVLVGKTVGLFGVGEISMALAARLKAFGMTVIGYSGTSGRSLDHFDRIEARGAIVATAAELDYLVVLVPMSPANDKIIGMPVLKAMKPGAFLINLARGGVLDEAALLHALDEGWIAGAALDVFAEEPLPAGNPLWDAPNVLVTPHIGGYSTTYAEQALPVVVHNLKAFIAGRPDEMRNLVPRNPSRPAANLLPGEKNE